MLPAVFPSIFDNLLSATSSSTGNPDEFLFSFGPIHKTTSSEASSEIHLA